MHEFKVSIADVIDRPGSYRDITVTAPLPGVGVALARLSESPVAVTVRAESLVDGILIDGSVRGEAALTCGRCLTEFGAGIDIRVCELFSAPGAADGDDDTYRIAGTEIDLEPMLRDAFGLALPLNPVCAAGCEGLCPGCGRDLNEQPCVCAADDVDPRWAALDEVRARLDAKG